jgi:hypothetical protein
MKSLVLFAAAVLLSLLGLEAKACEYNRRAAVVLHAQAYAPEVIVPAVVTPAVGSEVVVPLVVESYAVPSYHATPVFVNQRVFFHDRAFVPQQGRGKREAVGIVGAAKALARGAGRAVGAIIGK